jgi:hypothetical protein
MIIINFKLRTAISKSSENPYRIACSFPTLNTYKSQPHPETNPANPANPIISLEPSYHQVLNNRNAPSQPHNPHPYPVATYISNRSPMSEGNLGTPPPIKSISLPQKGHTA